MSPAMNGFWENLGTAASVDWCEANYIHSPWVAEWWNTLSSLSLIILGLAGWLVFLSRSHLTEKRFALAFALLAVVGFGSTAFHGTLLKYPQAGDELPMVYTSMALAYIVLRRRDFEDSELGRQQKNRRLAGGLLAYALAFSAFYFGMKSYFQLFIATYALMVAFVVIKSLKISFFSEAHPLRKRLLAAAAGSYLGGFFFLWIPEHVLLACDHPFQAWQPHAIFHLTSAVGSYLWILWSMADRMILLNQSPSLVRSGPFLAVIPNSEAGFGRQNK